MPSFGKASKTHLDRLDPRLQEILNEAIKYFDFSIIDSHRGKEAQDLAYQKGLSKVKWPHSKHNHPDHPEQEVDLPIARAVDIAPYPIAWNDTERFVYLAGWVMAIAALKGIKLRWGGDWDSDTQVKDEKFRDFGHFELVKD